MVCTTTNLELLGAPEPLFITFLLIKARQNLLVLSSVSGEEQEEKQSGGHLVGGGLVLLLS